MDSFLYRMALIKIFSDLSDKSDKSDNPKESKTYELHDF